MQCEQTDRQSFDKLIESLRREAFTAYELIREAQRDDEAMQARFAALQHAGESACRIYSSIAIFEDAVLTDAALDDVGSLEEHVADVRLRELVEV